MQNEKRWLIGGTMGGLDYVVTVLRGRTRGITLMRMPLTIWGICTASVLVLLAFPALFIGSVMMLLDRIVVAHFHMVMGAATRFVILGAIDHW